MKNVEVLLKILAVTILLAGCATESCNFQNSITNSLTQDKKETVKSYSIGDKNVSFVGSAMIKASNFNSKITTETIFLINSFKAVSEHTIHIPKELRNEYAKKNNYDEKIIIKKDDICPIRCYDDATQLYKVSVYTDCSFDTSLSCSYIFYIKKDGSIESISSFNKQFPYHKQEIFKYLNNAQKETKQNKTILPGSFGYELVYSGKDGNNIKVAYREYKDDMARPAFFQDLTYNLKESDIIRYKNYKIKVHKATNEEISYTVLED